jgi:transcriptional regulator with XRE-family HTH domain
MTIIDAAQWASPTPKGGHEMPSPFLGTRLKALRTERGWSQADLATRIDSDARQVSRYENSRISPSLEGLVKIAETLDITVDYLVVETAVRRPLHAVANPIEAHAADLATLSDDDRATITNVIDALVTKAKLRLITTGAS